MLTADAFGVLPPIARLSPAAAMYHFLSGYTAKVAGTERGVTEPKATFSTCFGAPFMVWDPNVYAKLLGERIAKHQAQRLAGEHRLDRRAVRRRLAHEDRAHPRDDQRGALRRSSTACATRRDPIFNLDVPTSCPDVPADVLSAAQHLEGQGGVRRAGEEARADVRRQLQDVRRRRPRREGRQGRRRKAVTQGLLDRRFEAVIGLEIHAQLLTETKIFCGCRTAFGAPPNTAVCPVCLGLPGALPVLNRRAVEFAIRAALALDCDDPARVDLRAQELLLSGPAEGLSDLAVRSAARDRPAGSSRRAAPRVGITRVHLEEDAGKSLHHGFADSDRATYLDFNRSGVPLIEIVTEPDLRSAADAAACFAHLRDLLVALGVNDGNMEEGSLRCDANVSVRPQGSDGASAPRRKSRTSTRSGIVQKALEFEIARQSRVLAEGGRVRQETRLWDSDRGETSAMRSKEEAHDYRYFPEPDLPPLRVDDDVGRRDPSHAARAARGAQGARSSASYGLSDYDADVLVRLPGGADYFEAVVRAGASAKAASNWIQGEVRRKLKEAGAEDARRVAHPSRTRSPSWSVLAERGVISSSVAKEVFERMWTTGDGRARISSRQKASGRSETRPPSGRSWPKSWPRTPTRWRSSRRAGRRRSASWSVRS